MTTHGYRQSLGIMPLLLTALLLTGGIPIANTQSTTFPQQFKRDNTITIDASRVTGQFSRDLLGSNLPAWVGSEKTNRLTDPTLRQRIKAAGVSSLRAPGSSWGNYYGWLSCEMGANQAKAQPCGENWFWAARPSDYIGLVQATGNALMWTVNPNGTAKEAAAAVAFFNGAVTNTTSIGIDQNGFDWQTVGRWAQLRTQRGYPNPLGIRLWQMGNELYGNKNCVAWGWEVYWTCDANEYVNGKGTGSNHRDGFNDFNNAMRAVDPTISVGAVGWVNQAQYSNWGNKVIAGAGGTMGFYSVHNFPFNDTPAQPNLAQTIITQSHGTWREIKSDIDAAFQAQSPNHSVPIAITEYNLASKSTVPETNKLMLSSAYALFVADSIGQMAQHGFSLANQWNIASGDDSPGIDFGLIRVDHQYQRTPAYYVLPIWAQFGRDMLKVVSPFDHITEMPIYAGRNAEGNITLLAINKTANPIKTNLAIQGAVGPLFVQSGDAYTLRSNGLEDTNAIYNNIGNVSSDLANAPPIPLAAQATISDYTFPAYSVTLLRLSPHSSQSQTFMPLMSR